MTDHETLADRGIEAVFDALAGRVTRQEDKYGPFKKDVADIRLALAVLQDELDEALLAWREDRRLPRCEDAWKDTIDEVRDVAGIAVRLLLTLEQP